MPGRSITEVLQDILRSLQDIVRAEFRLAKVELSHEAMELARTSAWLAAGAVLAILALGFALWSAVYGLALVMPLWGATLTVTLVLVGASGVLLTAGLRKFKEVRPVPERTIETMKENIEWLKGSSK